MKLHIFNNKEKALAIDLSINRFIINIYLICNS